MKSKALPLILLAASVLTDCENPKYGATIHRTQYGIPHVRASNYKGLGYGIGYAYAQDNVCILADKIMQMSGDRARYLGPTAPAQVGGFISIGSLDSDFFYKSQYDKETVAAAYGATSQEVRDLAAGYAAGYNRYLRDTGVENLPAPCKGAAWVRPVTEKDIYLWWKTIATVYGMQNFVPQVLGAHPPAASQGVARAQSLPAVAGPVDIAQIGRALGREPEGGFGSNAWAFGRDTTENGRGVLLGNPHWAWGNLNQFYEAHLTIPGEMDVMGATWGGAPLVFVGFNQSMAWSHTVSTGARFLVRELQLAAGDPTSYVLDGVTKQMSTRTVSVDVLGSDGTTQTQTRTFYYSEFGPIIVNPQLGYAWSSTTAYALDDVNMANNRLVEQWIRIAKSSDVAGLRSALTEVEGVPFANTLGADSQGNALYADISVKPYVSDLMLATCSTSPVARGASAAGVLTLDGWRSECNPIQDPAARQPGILPPSLLPMLERSDYVANGNNTYWLPNPAAPITGLPMVNGAPATVLGMRPRSGLVQIADRLAGRDGLPGTKVTPQAAQAMFIGAPGLSMGNRNYSAELVMDAVVGLCDGLTTVTLPDSSVVDVSAACAVLAAWDRHNNSESVGAHIYREFYLGAALVPGLWAVPFDVNDPVNTPRTVNVANPAVRVGLQQCLGAAVARLAAKGIPMAAPWGELHYQYVRGAKLSPAGGYNSEGILNANYSAPLSTYGYTPILNGSSYVQAVTFDDAGPVAEAVLIFGQSTNPASPYYFDQLEQLWSQRRWNRMPFTMDQIEADPAHTAMHITE